MDIDIATEDADGFVKFYCPAHGPDRVPMEDVECWACMNTNRRMYPDYNFMLETIERTQRTCERKERFDSKCAHHNVGQFERAVHLIRNPYDMRRFYFGLIIWFRLGDHCYCSSHQKAKDNIGFAIDPCNSGIKISLLRRFLWWFTCGIYRSDRCWA